MRTKIFITILITFFAFINTGKSQGFSFYSTETFDAIDASPKQREKLLEIQKDAEDKIAAIKRCPTATPEEKKEKTRTVSQERGKAYAAVLTRAQMVKVNRLRREYSEGRGGISSNANKKQGFSFYSTETFDAIKASPDQRKKLIELQKNAEERIAAIKVDDTLSAEERRAKTKEVSQQRGKTYAEILTRAQMVKVNRLRREYNEQR